MKFVGLGFVGRTQADDREREKYLVLVTAITGGYCQKGRYGIASSPVFIAIAEELSLRRAAYRLHVSQPALSLQISDLEDELGVELFTRNSRGVELTEAGRVFLIGGRRALAAAKNRRLNRPRKPRRAKEDGS